MSLPRRRGILFIAEVSNITQEPTGGQWDSRSRPFPEGHSLNGWMLDQRHRWNSVLSEMGQGELMGSIRYTWIPFILVGISQSHRSPLLKSYSANPLRHRYRWIVLCHDFHNPLCLPTYVLCLALSFITITSYCTFISWSWRFCLLSAPLCFRCLHTRYCYLFLANWSMRSPALNFWVYN